MIYCTHCGKEILADSQYCPFCGAHVDVVNKTVTEPVKTEQVVTEPVKTERVVTEPVRTERIVTQTADVRKDFTTRKTINEFYKDAGFWGGILLLAGFFLPFFSMNTGSLFDAIRVEASTDKIVLL